MMQSYTLRLRGRIVPGLIMLLIFITTFSYSQTQIKGRITDDAGSPLPGASVLVKGTSKGTVTDINGDYTLSASPSDVLIISFIGYQAKEVTVGSQTTLNVTLADDTQQLSEVVVVGYGTQKRADVTGAIASVDAEEITSVPVATADQALQGRAPGVTVVNNGSPGTNPTIRIRGLSTVNNNTPLFVVDGIIVSGIGDINPSDIESIQVLKDASTTAVYGSKGSNGVVIVTTKQGKSGAVKVTFGSYVGSQWTSNRFDLLSTDQYIDYATNIMTYDDNTPPSRFTAPQYAELLNNNTDWQDEIFRAGLMQNYNIGVSGGGENSNYRISAGYINQEGVLIETDYERFNLRGNSNYTLGKFEFGQTLSLAISEQSPETNNGGRSILEHAIKSAPYLPVTNVDNPGGFQGPNTSIDGQDAENPVRILKLFQTTNERSTVLGNVFAQYEIIEGLKFKTQLGGEYSTFHYNSFTPAYDDDSDGGTHTSNRAIISVSDGQLLTTNFTNSLNYSKTLAEKHNFEVLLLTEWITTTTKNHNGRSENFLTNEINQINNVNQTLQSFTEEYKRFGLLGRINYNYDGKYLFSASFRRDASSRFGENERWGSFPSLSLGWRISDEAFMSDVSLISNLKLRGSWGRTGNDNIGNYRYLDVIEDVFYYPIEGNAVLGATYGGLPNPDLKWEQTTMTNIGLDAGILDDKLTFTFEYYINKSDELLLPRLLPTSSGFHQGTFIENIGSMETKGAEVVLGYNDYSGDFQWSASLNLGTSKNEVLDLGSNDFIQGADFEGQAITRAQVGHPAFGFYGWKFDGIFQNQAEIEAHADQSGVQPGDFRIVDVNNDGVINDEDRTFIGNPFPTLTYGLNLSGSYKNFDLSVFINGVSGNDIYNTNIYDLQGMTRLFNSGVEVLDSWQGEGTSNTIPRVRGAGTNTQVSSRFVEDGSFARLRNITLGYNLPTNIFNGKISKFRIYVSAQNLVTITDYSGLDPEIGAYSASAPNTPPGAIGSVATNGNGQPTANFTTGIDFGNYPVAKSIIGGIEITF
ncbi:SusC/RagA family TonB-linked outer membrane protein [Fulvivirga sediminis]|uniref:TonB-dependent receptor n=1 Tax=Fulvivirga sediminis TaxID=2803949 RepID=A0A937FAA2_9BACT|nr:TonB-dependent receptor [Fulvivirga sediminis]MBL3658171.1 TonB-dependent receptor [Fulvivirga sediminis]